MLRQVGITIFDKGEMMKKILLVLVCTVVLAQQCSAADVNPVAPTDVAVEVAAQTNCHSCQNEITDTAFPTFFCQHSFHQTCLDSACNRMRESIGVAQFSEAGNCPLCVAAQVASVLAGARGQEEDDDNECKRNCIMVAAVVAMMGLATGAFSPLYS